MSRSYRLVVFDWEGTLGDTLGQILNTVADVAKSLQFGEFDESLARQYVVLGLVVAVKKLFPHLSMSQHEQLLQAVQYSLVTNPKKICLIPGAELIVQQLHKKGFMLAIATNKGQPSLQRALQATGLDAFFTITRSAGQVPAKPCPQMLLEIMETAEVSAEETLMVGDSPTDMEMAQQVFVDAIGVDFYDQQATSLRAAGALDVFDDYQQLASYLRLP